MGKEGRVEASGKILPTSFFPQASTFMEQTQETRLLESLPQQSPMLDLQNFPSSFTTPINLPSIFFNSAHSPNFSLNKKQQKFSI
jgi:hypothetical protein